MSSIINTLIIIAIIVGIYYYDQRNKNEKVSNDLTVLEEKKIYTGLLRAVAKEDSEELQIIYKAGACKFFESASIGQNNCGEIVTNRDYYRSLKKHYENWDNKDIPIHMFANNFKRNFPKDGLENTMEELIKLALANGNIKDSQKELLSKISRKLGFYSGWVSKKIDEIKDELNEKIENQDETSINSLDDELSLEESYRIADISSEMDLSDVISDCKYNRDKASWGAFSPKGIEESKAYTTIIKELKNRDN